MTRRCGICSLPRKQRLLVDQDIVGGTPYRNITQLYNVSKYAISRHRRVHIPEIISKGHEAQESADADVLLRQVKGLYGKAIELLNKAEEAGEIGTALRGIREARGNIELLAKMQGQLDERPVANIYIGEVVVEMILQALDPYPEAGLAVAEALENLELEAGEEAKPR
jgi:hypothetical protein